MVAIAWALGCLFVAGCPGGGPECVVDEDCPGGRYCQVDSCAFDCSLDAECPDEFTCTVRGRCARGCRETNGGTEICDWLDNDCDGQTDEVFPDLGQVCQNGTCAEGLFVCAPAGTGVVCDGPVPQLYDDTCDAFDDDCDGSTDEDAIDQPCELQAGVCAGTFRTCLDGGGWSSCAYGPDYNEFIDETCDGLDNDCDGLTDEDAAVLPMGEFGPHASDGLDNNCNGLVDEPGGVMVRVDDSFAIDAYESTVFASSNCEGQRYGYPGNNYPAGFPVSGDPTVDLYACSLAGMMPSAYLSWHRAQWACQAQGKRLCTGAEFSKACVGPEFTRYPYGGGFFTSYCNDGWGAESSLAETGAYAICESGEGIFDMSGNLGEWVATSDPYNPANSWQGGGYYTCTLCEPDGWCRACDRDYNQDEIMSIMDCAPGTQVPGNNYESFERSTIKPYLGARCCLDLP